MLRIQINLGEGQVGWLRNGKQLAHLIDMILNALVDIDLVYLKTHKVPELYKSGVRYQEEPPGTVESFDAIPAVLQRGWGDCDDLACWRVAELRAHGEQAHPRLEWRQLPPRQGAPNGGRLYHVVVRRADGSIEDPSALLGMNAPRQRDGIFNAVKNELLRRAVAGLVKR